MRRWQKTADLRIMFSVLPHVWHKYPASWSTTRIHRCSLGKFLCVVDFSVNTSVWQQVHPRPPGKKAEQNSFVALTKAGLVRAERNSSLPSLVRTNPCSNSARIPSLGAGAIRVRRTNPSFFISNFYIGHTFQNKRRSIDNLNRLERPLLFHRLYICFPCKSLAQPLDLSETFQWQAE